MIEARRADDGYWHVAHGERGVYLRIGDVNAALVIPTDVAKAIAAAIEEVTGA